jgi:hypothetical protein
MNPEASRILALLQKRLEGDDALLMLAARRFGEAGLGAELHASTPGELNRQIKSLPRAGAIPVVHLNREIDILDENSRAEVLEFASLFRGLLYGIVIHDQPEAADRAEEYAGAVYELDRKLRGLGGCPFVFIEYAAMIEPGAFTGIFDRIKDAGHVSACVDTGHLGIYMARKQFGGRHPEVDICSLTPEDPRLPELITDVEEAVSSSLPGVLEAIRALGRHEKPVHFHLHDGHPLSKLSPHGLSDHLSFLWELPVPFEHKGRRSLGLMFGPAGLSRIVRASIEAIGPELLSFTIEVHPQGGSLPLGRYSELFGHWRELDSAEKTNHWLEVILKNHELLLDAVKRCP